MKWIPSVLWLSCFAIALVGCRSNSSPPPVPPSASVASVDTDGNSPLAIAVLNGDLEQAKSLLAHGANVNAPNTMGMTPIFGVSLIAYSGATDRIAMAKMLISHGADLSTKDNRGKTAAEYAMRSGLRFYPSRYQLVTLLTPKSPSGANQN